MRRFSYIRDLPIKNKIIVIILIVAFTTISLGFVFITIKDFSRLKSEIQSNLQLNTKLIGDYCIVPLTFKDKQQAFEAISRLKFIESVEAGYLFDSSGVFFAGYPETLKVREDSIIVPERSALYKDGFFYITEPISYEGKNVGYLVVKANSVTLKKENLKLALILFLVFILMLVISYILSTGLQRFITTPILKLANITAEISRSHDFTIRLSPPGKDEIGFLYNQFNNMLEQLLKWKNMRDEAEREINFLAHVLKNINENVSITDLQDNIIFVNHSFLKTYGYSEEELIGQNINIVRSPNNPPEVVNEILPATLRGGWNGELMNKKKDGTEFPIYLFTTIIYDNDNKPCALVGICTDITEQKKAELELKMHRDHLQELVEQRTAELEKEKEKAQSADRLKSAFLATMSHELRTPLNSIIGFTGILLQEKPGLLNNEQKKQLGMVQQSARHLLSLINDILDISKIEAGQLKLSFSAFYLPEIIQKVIDTNKHFAEKKNLELVVSIEENVGEIYSDRLRVQQILLNLVNNAIKFTEVGSVSLDCFLEKDFVKIKISDTGIGIENDKIDQLFRPFSQIDTGLTRKHEGTGLGLSICKRLTEMLGGTIDVESTFGKGSVFTVTLPFNKEKNETENINN